MEEDVIDIVPLTEQLLPLVLPRAIAAYQYIWGTSEAYAERFTDDEAARNITDLSDFWLAMAGAEVAGFVGGEPASQNKNCRAIAACKPVADAYYIADFGVMPSFRGRGLGGRLLAHLMASASERGFNRFFLQTTLHDRNSAVKIYREAQFQPLLDDRNLPVVRIVRRDRFDSRPDKDCRVYLTSQLLSEPRPASPTPPTDFSMAVKRGLLGPTKKTLPCRFSYDAFGSDLFEKICMLPEYYPTRCEAEILEARASEIAQLCRGNVAVIEMGSGSATKTRTLLRGIMQNTPNVTYVPIDISSIALAESEAALLKEFPALKVKSEPGEYEACLTPIETNGYDTVLVLWLGTSIGNIDVGEAERLLKLAGKAAGRSGITLLGIDLRKDKQTLELAYNDAQGVTAKFNLNLLHRINRELGGKFDVALFRHVAFYNEAKGRIEMHIESLAKQSVEIASLGLAVDFQPGERVHTENSYKYSREEISKLAWRAGLKLSDHWRDSADLFSLNVLRNEFP